MSFWTRRMLLACFLANAAAADSGGPAPFPRIDPALYRDIGPLDGDGRLRQCSISADDAWITASYEGRLALSSVEAPRRRLYDFPIESSGVAAISPDGKWIAAGEREKVRVLDATTGSLQAELNVPGPVMALEFCPRDSSRLLVSADEVTLWDWPLRRVLFLRAPAVPFVYQAALSPSASRVAMPTSRGTIEVWEVISRTKIVELSGHGRNVFSVVFSHDGSRLATGGLDCTARVWDGRTGAEILRIPTPWQANRVAFLPDGRHLAVGSSGLAIHRLSDGRQVAGFATGLCYGLAVGRGGRTIVVQDAGRAAHVLRLP